ncbi:MAG: hypothetical protein UZ12_BCD005000328 [Bacteroidetes bacterium OLB12]|nr:MAG: hypothetical protein UZ12_BCD005000328 [Bacteroidetes bacterium OLB12]
MKPDSDIAMPTQKRGHFKNALIRIALLQREENSELDFVQDNWHFTFFFAGVVNAFYYGRSGGGRCRVYRP